MRKVTLLIFFSAILILAGYSQTKQESIKELFHLMQKDSIIDRITSSRLPELFKMEQIKNLPHSENAEDSVSNKLQIVKELSEKIQKEEMALFDKYFSQDEIDTLIAFYKSPVGHKFIALSPKIQIDMMLIIQQKYGPEIQKLIFSLKNQQ